MQTAPPIRFWRKGCEEVSYSSIGSSGFIDSGVGGKVAMNCREAASPMPVPQTCGMTAVFHAWARAAIFLHSVNPPEEQRSGWRMSRAPSEIQGRKPVFPNRFSPAARWVSVRCLKALYPSRSSGAIGVHHDKHPRPDGLAYGADVLDVQVHPEAHLELYGPETFGEVPLRLANAGLGGVLALPAVEPCGVRGELGAEPSPEQLVDGLGEGAPYGVPEGYIHAAQGVERRAAPEGSRAIVHLLPKHLGVEGVPAEEHRLVAELDEGG